jgi:hypothetical protein
MSAEHDHPGRIRTFGIGRLSDEQGPAHGIGHERADRG